jgi:hypothetical protein
MKKNNTDISKFPGFFEIDGSWSSYLLLGSNRLSLIADMMREIQFSGTGSTV